MGIFTYTNTLDEVIDLVDEEDVEEMMVMNIDDPELDQYFEDILSVF